MKNNMDNLLVKLNSTSPDIRESALEFIAEHPPSNALQLVIPLLSDIDDEVRGTAAFCLGEIGNMEVIPYLLTYISQETSEGARTFGIEALEKLQTPEILFSLVNEAYRSEGRAVRVAVARQLGNYDDPRSIDALLYLWSNTNDPHVGINVVDALEKLNQPKLKSFWKEVLQTTFHPYMCTVALRSLKTLEEKSKEVLFNEMINPLHPDTGKGAFLSMKENNEADLKKIVQKKRESEVGDMALQY